MENTEIKQLLKLSRETLGKEGTNASVEQYALRWAINELPIEFTKWFLINSENYYAGVSTIEEMYNKFKNI